MFAQVWCLLEDLPDDSDFHPDGIHQCPPNTYTILQDNGRNIKCASCPICPAGEEPTPPCGITLVTKVVGECTTCKPESFSDQQGSMACKSCTECGSHKVINSCTTTKDTECNECPLGHYKDDWTFTCKHCSLCCQGKHSTAKWKCIVFKRCTPKCTHAIKSTIRLDDKYFDSSYITASTVNNERLKENAKDRSNMFSIRVKTKRKRLVRSKVKRDTNLTLEEPKQRDNIESQPENTIQSSSLGDTLLLDKVKDLQRSDSPSIVTQNPESTSIPGMEDDDTRMFSTRNTRSDESISTTYSKHKDENSVSQRITPPSITTKSDLWQLTFTTPTVVPASAVVITSNSKLISASYILDNFLGTCAALFLFGMVAVILFIAYRKFCPQTPTGYRQLSSKEKPTATECGGGYSFLVQLAFQWEGSQIELLV